MRSIPVFLGLDVGKKRDRAAWVGVVPKKLCSEDRPLWSVVVCEQAPIGTSYAAVAERSRELAAAFAGEGWPVMLAVDATGIGAAVVEDLRSSPVECEVLAVTAHGGKKITGEWPDLGVPKEALVGGLDEAIRGSRLTVTASLPAAGTLKDQLKAYVAKVTESGHVRYEAEHERDHDDTVSAAQLAVFGGGRWWSICRHRAPGRD